MPVCPRWDRPLSPQRGRFTKGRAFAEACANGHALVCRSSFSASAAKYFREARNSHGVLVAPAIVLRKQAPLRQTGSGLSAPAKSTVQQDHRPVGACANVRLTRAGKPPKDTGAFAPRPVLAGFFCV
jgi:hypothetical protein